MWNVFKTNAAFKKCYLFHSFIICSNVFTYTSIGSQITRLSYRTGIESTTSRYTNCSTWSYWTPTILPNWTSNTTSWNRMMSMITKRFKLIAQYKSKTNENIWFSFNLPNASSISKKNISNAMKKYIVFWDFKFTILIIEMVNSFGWYNTIPFYDTNNFHHITNLIITYWE